MDADTVDPRWQGLCRLGGVAALVSAALILVGVVAYLAWPPPEDGSVVTWFALFQRNWLAGMLGLDLAMLASYVVLIPVLLALYIALRRTSASLMALATTLALVSIATYFASSRLFEMLALSRQYAAATTEAQRASLVAAGQSMLTTYLGSFGGPASMPGWTYQGTAFNVSFVLWSAAGVMISVAMLRSGAFARVIGSLGIAGNVATFGLFVPVVGVVLSLISLPLLLTWYVLIAARLFRLGRSSQVAAQATMPLP